MLEFALGRNLQELMTLHGNLSTSELARLTQVPQPTLHHILTGATKRPRKKALQALANFFAVSVDQLMGKESLPNLIPETIKKSLKIQTVPIIDWELVKHWPLPQNEQQQFKELLLDKAISEHSFALTLQDTSLEPTFTQGSLLIFDYDKKPVDRNFILVHLREQDEILFNRLFIENDEYFIKQTLSQSSMQLLRIDPKLDNIVATLVEARVIF